MVMLSDITGWLRQQEIPYFITYGTLLGAKSTARDVQHSRSKSKRHEWSTVVNGCHSFRDVFSPKGAVREHDILPWTQAHRLDRCVTCALQPLKDMDIVIDRSYWPKLQQGLEARRVADLEELPHSLRSLSHSQLL